MPRLAANFVGGQLARVKGFRLGLLAAAVAIFPLIVSATADADRSDQISDADLPNVTEASTVRPGAIVMMNDEDPMYDPVRVVIQAGQTVEWRNRGMVSHSVADDPKRAERPENVMLPHEATPFNSFNIMPGGIFRHAFMVPGKYRYFCLSHEGDKMIGEVFVEPVPAVHTRKGGPAKALHYFTRPQSAFIERLRDKSDSAESSEKDP